MRQAISLLALLYLSGSLFAQSGSLILRVLDEETGFPLEFATATLLHAADSMVVSGGITGQDGRVELPVDKGRYLIKLDFIAYTSRMIGPVELDQGERRDMGSVNIYPEAALLSEIEVSAEKTQMQLKLDKKVYNVGKDIANSGSTAADILDNVPSVTVDVEGNVSLRGSQGVRILIDGRPSGQIGIGDSDGLRSLPSNLIDRIEVITNPSARYEAEGMAGIINIVLKKERQEGVNGSFETTLGWPTEWGGAANVNYRRSMVNLFANYGIRYRSGPGSGTQYQEFYRNDSIFINDQIREHDRKSLSHNIRLGMDLFIGKESTLTSSFNYRYSQDDNLTRLTYRDYLEDLQHPTLVTYRTDEETELEPTLEYALNWKRTFGKEDHIWTADVRYQDNGEHETSRFTEQYLLPDSGNPANEDLLQRSDNLEAERQLILQSDYQIPMSANGQLEMGLRAGLRDIDNQFEVEELSNDIWMTLPGFKNQFQYDENIYAAYAIWGEQWNPISVQAGLRYEYSDIRTRLIETGITNPRSYGQLFPSAHLSYQFPNEHSLQISYSRRINRPGFRDLNPFLTFSDVRNIWTGNPNLDPELTNAYELGYLKTFAKGSFSPVVFYRTTENVIDRIRTVDAEGISYIRPENLAFQQDIGLEVTFSYQPMTWWRLNGNVNFFRSITDGKNIGADFTADTYTWFGRLSSRISLFKKVDLQINYNYRAPRATTQGRYGTMQHVDVGASMDVLKNRATVTLSGRDIFNTRRRIYENTGDDFLTEGNFLWRRGSVNLTFAYRLNQKKSPEKTGEPREGGEEF